MKYLLSIFILFLCFQGFCQDNQLVQDYQNLNLKGMQVLLGWSVLNITTGSAGNFLSEGESRYFYQMNAGWNLVNAGLAIYGLHNFSQELDLQDFPSQFEQTKKLYLINAGLDVAYIAGGIYMMTRSNIRTRGYGQSIALQGMFLLVFDAIMYYLNQKLDF